MTQLLAERPQKFRTFHGHPTLVLTLILTCQLMVVLDATIVNVALPHIQSALHFSATDLSWVVSAYTLTFGGLLLLGARAGDILGRRRTFLFGVALFTLASLIGGFSTSAGMLLAARAVQGVGAAVAAPAGLALLTTMFSEGRERTRALALYTAVSIGGAAIGLIAGGMLTEWTSWRWVLFVNIPIGVFLVVGAAAVLPETQRHTGKFDIAGAVTSTVGMTALVYRFVHAASAGWSDPQTVASFLIGVAMLGTFVVVERRAVAPITPLALFADGRRNATYLGRLLMVAGVMGMFFFLTQFLQDVLGYSALQTGFAFLPLTVALFTSSQFTSRVLMERFAARTLMLSGLALSTAGLFWLTFLSEQSAYWQLLGPVVMFGIGNGTAFLPLTTASLAGVAPEDSGAASGLLNVMQQAGGALGLAVLVTVFGSASRGATPPLGASAQEAARFAFVAGAERTFQFAAAFLLAAMVLLAITQRKPNARRGPKDQLRTG
ncbi:MFS transporter [Antrihabitans cavernicola]|uniref:MFS transporter n=1 Tax=Antrihabitans cavernicola TaxID=2495913 RepID=A0A5A7SAC6_9NOCA|nr:MFS transporter [Spelaeibacter cavernicola]KAA0023128.1 MFS transporter [Spelaeibacter cavernicola]